MTKIISQPALPPRARNPRFPADLEQVLMKCLHKDPDKRYQTMLELERAVQEVLIREGTTTNEDVASFVRTLMGDRGQKRRAQLRDAVRLLDERAAAPSPAEGPLIHEGVSELVLTQMKSGVGRDLAMSRQSTTGSYVLPDSAVLTSPTHLPMEVPAGRRRSGVVVAVAGVALVGLLGAGFVLLSGSKPGEGVPAAPPPPSAEAPPPPPSQTAPLPSASGSSTSSPLDVTALPDKPDLEMSDEPTSRHDPKSGPAGKPSAAPSSTTTTKPSTKWVPTVTNPGF